MLLSAVLVALCIGALSLAIASNAQLRDSANALEASSRQSRTQVFRLTQALTDMETGQRGYLLTGQRTFLAPYEIGSVARVQAIEELRALNDDPGVLRRLDVIEAASAALLQEIAQSIEMRRRGVELSQTLTLEQATSGKARMDALREETAGLLEFIEAKRDAATAREQNAASRLSVLVALLAFLALGSSALSLWTLRRERRSWTAANASIFNANQALEEARRAAEAADAAKTRFLATASHDLRQPLHAISLYLSALRRRAEGAEAQKIITNMERATQSMVGMFSSLLDLARIQSNAVDVEIEDISLQQLFDAIAAEFTGAVTVAPTQLHVRTDKRQLETIVRNLAANAIRHGGGHATLAARLRDNGVFVSVSDRGPGVPHDKREEIFEEFKQLTGAKKAEGLGLGLSIVRQMADNLRLPVIVEDNPGGGAMFGVIAPRAAVAAPASDAAHVAIDLSGSTILLLDDDPAVLAAMAQTLRDAGATVDTAETIAEMNGLIDSGARPHLLIVDLRINGQLLGVEAGVAARQRITPRPALMFVSGETGRDVMEEVVKSGFTWLTKPVGSHDLVARASWAVGRARTPLPFIRALDGSDIQAKHHRSG